ncbi:MAG: histidine--tRNA ligase [Chlorobi bacterium]|nr:histidine--tRNA ligase [Chlorobiota bacterium]MCI0716761.1 histidine--tRNA ligase [Chlorobiota bacterium]
MKFQKPKGTKDILPKDIHKWHFVEKTIREATKLFNFSEIRTPTFEYTELFKRGVGSETDIVGKEMYTFVDKGGESITLKPEGTAPVMRAYLENSLSAESPLHKLYYITSMFRYEKPQAGRYREHSQFGGEIIGSDSIDTDVELILLAKEVYNRCGINNFKLKINSIGKPSERKTYVNALTDYLKKHFNRLSEESKKRLGTNPLRILDSKSPDDLIITKEAPKIIEHLTKDSRNRFDLVLYELTRLGVNYEIDFRLVRGLDYYTDTTFEFISSDLGAQDALGGGGRYDGLIELLGGKPTPGVGFGSGIERLIIVAEKNGFTFGEPSSPKVYFIALNSSAKEIAFKIMMELRKKNISCETDLLVRSMKAQMREANKIGSDYVFIIGDDELKNQKGILKKMSDGSQQNVEFDKLREYLN